MRSARAVKDLAAGTLVLFRFADKIVGEGVVTTYQKKRETDKSALGEQVTYEATTTFAPSSLRLYSPPVPIEALQEIVGSDPNMLPSAQPYFIIKDWSVYPKLLAVVLRAGTLI